MSSRFNSPRITNRDRMPRQGVEDVKGKTSLAGKHPKWPRRKLSEAESREQAAATLLAWRESHTAKGK